MKPRSAAAPSRRTPDSKAARVSTAVLLIAIGLWSLTLLVGLGYAVLVNSLGSMYCEPFEGSSQYGELRWSVWPPGPTCSFTQSVHGFSETRGPTPVMTIWIAAIGIGLCLIVALIVRRQSRRTAPGGSVAVAGQAE